MQCYTELVPPTAVTASISLPLLSSAANNLVIARSSLIEVFALKSVLASPVNNNQAQTNGSTKAERKERQLLSKLVLVGRYNASGTVTGLGRVKALKSKSGGELLLVSLRDAKLSLLQWDPEKHSISTVSIHYYEREDLQGSPFDPNSPQRQTHFTVDPGSRCAALQFGARKLAILPFHQGGDDLAMDDLDDTEMKLTRRHSSVKGEGENDSAYSASFVLSLLTLDPALIHPIHVAFLHGYREPTIGILSSQTAPSVGLLAERRDTVNFTVYTLDLEQKASTSLLSVTGLPYDITRIIPLPEPIGGALLLGSNELVHVDQSGKTSGVAVNESAQDATNFALALQSDLDLKLEGCAIEQMGGPLGQLLIVLSNGRMAVLTFKVDGRTVSGLTVELILPQNGGECLQARPSCTATVGRGRIFVGSEDSDSTIVGWSSTVSTVKRQRTEMEVDNDSDAELDFEESEDENDLYSEAPLKIEGKSASRNTGWSVSASETVFRVHDSLMNLAPLRDLRIIELQKTESSGIESGARPLELICSTGRGKEGNLTRLRPTLQFEKEAGLGTSADLIWSLHTTGSALETTSKSLVENETTIIVTSKQTDEGAGSSRIFSIDNLKPIELTDTEFESEAGTVEMASIADGTKVVQVLSTEIRIYDGDFALTQIFPLYEEQSESGPKIVSASIEEPYILVCREDNTMLVLKENDSGDLERVEGDDALAKTQWESGSLFDDVDDAFHLASEAADDEEAGSVLLFLLGSDGSLQIFRPPNFQTPIYVAGGLGLLPPYLTPSFGVRRSSARGALKEILVTHLGDATHQTPYLILRSVHDDVVLYQPFQDSARKEAGATLQFLKVNDPYITTPTEERSTNGHSQRSIPPLRPVQLTSGLATVFVPGASPRLIVKTARTEPRTFCIRASFIQQLAAFRSEPSDDSVVSIAAAGDVSIANLPRNADFSTGWVVQQLYSDDRIVAYDYHRETKRFVMGTSRTIDFRLPQDDELHPEWREETTEFLPTTEQDNIKLMDPATGTITDTVDLESYEVVTCIQTMSLEVSEVTRERRELVVVGTALVRGEDLQTQGCVYVFDVISVVPEPNKPETGRKLKQLAKIKDKGAVTAVTQVGSEGFLLIAHGQKCYVRGLKEDGSLLPVAFMDTQCYVSVAKELRGTNLCMLGDAFKGLWFVGYTEEPYGMKLFGKGANHLEVISAEFLPIGTELYILAVDADGDLYTYRYDPDQPKSLDGQRLLQTSTFHTGTYPSSMTLVPRTATAWDAAHAAGAAGAASSAGNAGPDAMAVDSEPAATAAAAQQVLLAADDGRLALLAPLAPAAYRTLTALQSYLTNSLPHPLGLNPKAWRNADVDLGVGGRAVLDGNILRRWPELGTWKRAESLGRMDVGGEWEVRALLDSIGAAGLGFL